MIPVSRNEFIKAEQRGKSSSGFSETGGTLILSIYLIRSETGTFGVVTIAQWTTMPSYRGDDFLCISHSNGVSPVPNRAQCTSFYDYKTRTVETNALGMPSYGPWFSHTGVSKLTLGDLYEKGADGYVAKVPLAEDYTVRLFAPNRWATEFVFTQFTTMLSYMGDPAYPQSTYSIHHLFTFFHQKRFTLHFDDFRISMPYQRIKIKGSWPEPPSSRISGSTSISRPAAFDTYELAHSFRH